MKYKTAKTVEYQRSSEIDRSRFSERNNISFMDRLIYRFKVILLGDYCVGKTSIINRYVEDVYSGDYNCTLGVEFKIKSLLFDEKSAVDLQIWDTCGHDKYRGITKQYFKDKNGAILVYDITNRKSFEALVLWLDDIINYGSENIQIIIIGNKLDKSYQRDISFEEANRFCEKNNLKYFEASALNGKNIPEIFESLSKLMIQVEAEKENSSLRNSTKSRIKLENRNTININKSQSSEQSDEAFSEVNNINNKKSYCC